MYLSRFPRSLPRVPLPSLQFDCQGTGGRESPKPGSGPQMRGGGGGGQTSLRLGYCCIWLSEPLMMVFINQLSPLLSSPPHSVHSIRSVMQKYLEERDELTFDKIFNQKIGKSQSDFFKAHYPLRKNQMKRPRRCNRIASIQ